MLANFTLYPTEVSASDITYNIVDYPSLENGYTVSGTLTTNGATGTELPTTDLTSWDIIISKGSTVVATLDKSTASPDDVSFDATTKSITIASLNDFIGFTEFGKGTDIQWATFTVPNFTAHVGNATAWSSSWSLSDPVATAAAVPEPSTGVLALIGVAVAITGRVLGRRAKPRLAQPYSPAGPDRRW